VRLFSLSVDLDEVECYLQIHGMVATDHAHAVYDVALKRIRDFASRLSLPLTLFVIGRDLDREANRLALGELIADGHEIGNHSRDHFYDLTRRSAEEQTQQVEAASAKIRSALGVTPSGFRAPGYTVTDQLLSAVRASGLTYDSSVFPSPMYYAAKAAVLLKMKLSGRPSSSILDTWRVLGAPRGPYLVGQPYWARGEGLLELPIQAVGRLGVPFIGTTLTLLGPMAARALARTLVGAPFINLELHGLDFLDAGDVPQSLVATQPDLRVPLQRKLDTLEAVVETLRAKNYGMVRLDEAARVFARGLA
jgi:peptidoglycan/xylan/chitin deacetylase (PgdA/CDA1 family)